MNRKTFIKSSIIVGTGISIGGCLTKQPQEKSGEQSWHARDVAHILPTVSHDRILVSVSFKRKVGSPTLKVSNQSITGQLRDSKGFFWAFDCTGLKPDTQYELQLSDGREALCDAWPLKTFPIPTADAEKRVRLLQHGLSFKPDAVIVIGDTVYWDLTGNGKGRLGTSQHPKAIEIAGKFDEKSPVLGTPNEEVLKKAVSPQIINLYGTACRSTPVFFFNDDHDYFENDEANEALVTFPPKPFQLELGRTVQRMYFPEFLPDENRPKDLPGSRATDRVAGSSESFGTLRYGKLAELLMYDCRRFVTLSNDKATFIPAATENWLISRTQSQEVKHTIHVPSTPYGWSAGKWLEWYPDVLGKDKKLHADLPKDQSKCPQRNRHGGGF